MQHNQRDIGGTSRTEGLSPGAVVRGGAGHRGWTGMNQGMCSNEDI